MYLMFKPQHSAALFIMPGFVRICKDGCKRKGGGVCVFAKNVYKISKTAVLYVIDYTEDLWIDIISVDGLHINACVCCYPPKPLYDTRIFIHQLVLNCEHFLAINSDYVYILTSDLHQLDNTINESQFGFVQLVNSSTHNKNIIDKFQTTDLIYLISMFTLSRR